MNKIDPKNEEDKLLIKKITEKSKLKVEIGFLEKKVKVFELKPFPKKPYQESNIGFNASKLNAAKCLEDAKAYLPNLLDL